MKSRWRRRGIPYTGGAYLPVKKKRSTYVRKGLTGKQGALSNDECSAIINWINAGRSAEEIVGSLISEFDRHRKVETVQRWIDTREGQPFTKPWKGKRFI